MKSVSPHPLPHFRLAILSAVLTAGIIITPPPAQAGEKSGAAGWPQWRGPQRDGHVAATPAWPGTLGADRLTQAWHIPLGPSYSGPILVGDLVITTETRDKKSEGVRALKADSGQEVWSASWDGSVSVPFFAKSNGDWIRSTPATDGERIYVAGMRDVLVCLDAATGKELWRKDFVKEFGAEPPAFGFVCSPLVDGNAVYVQAGGGTVKVNKLNGDVIWRGFADGGGMNGSAFSSPVIATLAGQRQLIVQSREKLAGLDPSSGTALWESPIEAFRGMNILTPVVFRDGVFTSTYGGRSVWLQVAATNGALAATEKWSQNEQGYMSTPVVIGDFAYHHLRSQRLVCFDLRSGEEKWTSDEKFGKYMSLVAQGDRLLALDERGVLYLIAASPDRLQILSERKVSADETWAHLAVSGSDLFIRDLKGLARWRWQ